MASRRKTGRRNRKQGGRTRKQRRQRRVQRGGSGIFSAIADFFNGTTPINHPAPNPQSLVDNVTNRSPVLNPVPINTNYGNMTVSAAGQTK